MKKILKIKGREFVFIQRYTPGEMILSERIAFGTILKRKGMNLVYLMERPTLAVWYAWENEKGELSHFKKCDIR